MIPGEHRVRHLMCGVVMLITLLAASFVAGSGRAFAETVAADQYASAASDQYQDATNGQMPVGPNDPVYLGPPDQEPPQAEPSQTPASPGTADPGLAQGSPGAFDEALTEASANLDSIGQSLAALGSNPAPAPNPDQCVPSPSVFCVGGGDPLPPPTVVDPCTPGPGVACIGGAPQPGSSTTNTSGPTGLVASLFDSFLQQANDNLVTTWLVDDPGDSDGDGAVSTDLNPGSNDADPSDRDGDNQVFSDPDEFDPDE